MRNERGFILPVTIAISILFFLVFSFQINAYLTEKSFYKETEELFVLENLMQVGIKDVLVVLDKETGPIQNANTVLTYPSGTITYSFSPVTTTTVEVFISCVTSNLRKYSAEFTYDFETRSIVKWLEYR